MVEKFKLIYKASFQPELIEEILKEGTIMSFDAGHLLLEFGTYVRSIPLLIDGSIKIMRQDEKGHEILLYFLRPGETCAMTLSCCLGHKKSEVKAVAETPITIMNIPVYYMEEWSSKYKSWRIFVFDNYHAQMMNAFKAIDNIAFSKLDYRLVDYLKQKREINDSNSITVTHQEIANDLNSSRVVISRLLKRLEIDQKIELKHNCIEIIAL